jgi:excisionase family DNA binding protein
MGVRPLVDQGRRPVRKQAAVPADAEEGVVDTGDRLLTPGEVAALFRVDPKTVTRWAAAGRIGSIRTPGGHRRFRESEVRALLEGEGLMEPEDNPGSHPNGSHPNGTHPNGNRQF